MFSLSRLMFSLLLVVLIIGNFYAAFNGYRKGLDIAEELLVDRLNQKHELLSSLITNNEKLSEQFFVEETLYQFFRDNHVVASSHNAHGETWVNPRLGLSFVSYRDVRWRTYTAPVGNGLLLVGERYDTFINVLENLLVSAVLPLIWIIPALAIVMLLIIRRGFQPLRDIASVLSRRSDTDFSPIVVDHPARELSVVVQSMNSLLQRLGRSYDREQRFASYAAHELRSPITSMKLGLHNLVKNQGLKNDSSLQAIELNIERMQSTIEQLLLLAKIGDEQVLGDLTEVNLQPLLADLLAQVYMRAEKRHQTISLEGDQVTIWANHFVLQVAFANLIDNAIKYTPHGGEVRVSVSASLKAVTVFFEDSGPGIAEDEISKVFDRFYRVGGDRHASGVTGTGLGMSIVWQGITLHRGHVELLRSSDLGGLCVKVTIPINGTDTVHSA